ncbi:10170_t:CDS:2, partial [Dentiscutata heterogama]
HQPQVRGLCQAESYNLDQTDQHRVPPSSLVPIVSSQGHQSVGGLHEPYENGPYSSGQVELQQGSPVSYGSPSHSYVYHSENNFVTNELSMPMNAVQQNRTRNVGESSPITNTFGPPVQYPSVMCPAPVLVKIYACPSSINQIQYSCEHSAPINTVGTSQGQQQMSVSSGRENNSQTQNSSTIASPTHWDNANYLNMTSAPEFQTVISQTPVHLNGIADYTYEG